MLIRPTAIACAMLATSAAAQSPPTLVRLEPGTCPTCTVALEKVAVIGRATDKELAPEHANAVMLADGGFAVSDNMAKQPILRYDAAGRLLGAIGTLGDGPGEYRGVFSLSRARGDSLSLLSYGRLSTISVKSGRGRSDPLPQGTQSFEHVVLTDGRALLNIMNAAERRFALLTPKAQLITRFGPVPTEILVGGQGGRLVGDQYSGWVALAPSPSGGAWAGSTHYSHRVQKVAADGKVLLDVARKPAWFQPYTYADMVEKSQRLGELRTPSPAKLTGVGVSGEGLLFTVFRVADAKWKADPKAPPPAPASEESPVENRVPTGGIERYVDAILEVYRERDGAFLGAWRSDALLGSMLPNGMLWMRSQDDDGVVSYTVYRVKVTGAK
ncbi:MAG: hypothetical protein KA226_13955 [Gemmatimonadales bacterium]|nr:hypothetical protein [Gemmatimonadales bacterium]